MSSTTASSALAESVSSLVSKVPTKDLSSECGPKEERCNDPRADYTVSYHPLAFNGGTDNDSCSGDDDNNTSISPLSVMMTMAAPSEYIYCGSSTVANAADTTSAISHETTFLGLDRGTSAAVNKRKEQYQFPWNLPPADTENLVSRQLVLRRLSEGLLHRSLAKVRSKGLMLMVLLQAFFLPFHFPI
jgi:hypothetical protein